MRRLLGRIRTEGSWQWTRLELAALLAPYLLGVIALVVLPLMLTFAMAFTQYDALTRPTWTGLSNFRTLLRDRLFWIAVRNSLFFAALAVPLRVAAALLAALLLKRPRRLLALYRGAIFLPTVVPDVAYALIWLWIFNPIYGPLNMLLHSVGLPTPAWLTQPSTALFAIVIMSVFQIGEGFVVLLAGLHDVPDDLYHAAAVDGGTRYQMFRYITLPLLSPWLLLLTIRDIIVTTQTTFTPAYLMTGGGPYYATLFLPLLIYDEAFDGFRFGLAAALTLLVFLGVMLLLVEVYYLVWSWGDAHA